MSNTSSRVYRQSYEIQTICYMSSFVTIIFPAYETLKNFGERQCLYQYISSLHEHFPQPIGAYRPRMTATTPESATDVVTNTLGLEFGVSSVMGCFTYTGSLIHAAYPITATLYLTCPNI